MKKSTAGALLLALALVLVVPGSAAGQCAMCRTAFDSEEGQRVVGAYRAGVLFLLGVPFAAFGTVAFLAVRARRRLDADARAAGPE